MLPQSARDPDEDIPIQVRRYLDFLPVDRQTNKLQETVIESAAADDSHLAMAERKPWKD
jgi:hypothetical protein